MKGIIYKYTSPSGKSYIGQTTRNRQKRGLNGKGYSHSTAFNTALLKYGYSNFVYTELQEIEAEDIEILISRLNELEIQYIKSENTLAPFGYNLNEGGGNKNTHQLTREKLRKLNLGKKASLETRAKISLALTMRERRPKTEEEKERIRQALLGKKHTPERRLHQSLARLGKEPWNKGKKVPLSNERKAQQAAIGYKSLHERWHVNRGIVKESCTLCI